MKSFLKYTLATVTGILILNILGVILLMIIIGASSGDKEVKVKPGTVLEMKLDRQIIERASENPFANLMPGNDGMHQALGLADVLESISKAKNDSNIRGIYLELPPTITTGFATLQEIRNALTDFRSSGKFVVAYSEMYTHKAYYLASAADSVFLNPQGDMFFVGLSSQIMFFKKAFEKWGIEPEIFRHGKFKGAVEPFMYEKLSPENREQIEVFLGAIWSQMLTEIGASRKIEVSRLQLIADSLLVEDANEAVALGLIDGLRYKDQITEGLKKAVKTDADDDLQTISIAKYKKVESEKDEEPAKDKIAVIYANGEIGGGEGDMQSVGSEGLSKAIREARTDKKVKAIVLRVNSPGGSALASDVIYRELLLAKKEKPLIVSMGDVAASGGYYISCLADTIVASQMTITGSIGVFGMLANVEKLLGEKIGITVDTVNTNKYSDLGSPFRKMQDGERRFIQKKVESVYETFITIVSQGRNMSKEMVDSIGQGRVWAGADAKTLGLVDSYGGLQTAVSLAAKAAGIEKYRIKVLPEEKDPFEQFIEDISGDVRTRMVEKELGEALPFYRAFTQLKSRSGGIYVLMPYVMTIE